VLFWDSPMSTRSALLVPFAALAVGCGGSSTPGGPGPVPSVVPGSAVSGFVFYDENGNGLADPSETVRLPGVTVAIGAQTAQSSAGGRFTVNGVPAGSQSASARPDTLPAYFAPGAAVALTAPQSGGDVAVPATLALGGRARPNVYLAYGDSINFGTGASGGGGYPDWLESDLRSHWGRASLENGGVPGTRTNQGETRLWSTLSSVRPAYLLILYGTNDWNDPACRSEFPCYTPESLRSMVYMARDAGALPVVGTIPPVNPAFTDRNPDERNDWVRRMNDLVRAMARQERVPIAEVHAELLEQSTLPPLFADFVHPNDAGYRVVARAFFDAITKPLAASGSGRAPAFFFSPPAGP
jgi:acyl-CoA thioesterase I